MSDATETPTAPPADTAHEAPHDAHRDAPRDAGAEGVPPARRAPLPTPVGVRSARKPRRRRRTSPWRVAVQLSLGALAAWAITHPRSPLRSPATVVPESPGVDDTMTVRPPTVALPPGTALPGGALPGVPIPMLPGAPLSPPTTAPLGAGGRPYSPHSDGSGALPARERLAAPARSRLPWWLGGRDTTTRRRWSVPRLTGARLFRSIEERARLGERVAVTITAYCLQGRTRRGNWVRDGIVAADPRLFPLGREMELWIGLRAAGRHLIDDTGSAIKGARLDLWMADCGDARRFGRRRGYAQLVPRR